MTRRPPNRAAVAVAAALTIAAVGLARPDPVRIEAPALGKVAATWQPSFCNIRLTVEIRP